MLFITNVLDLIPSHNFVIPIERFFQILLPHSVRTHTNTNLLLFKESHFWKLTSLSFQQIPKNVSAAAAAEAAAEAAVEAAAAEAHTEACISGSETQKEKIINSLKTLPATSLSRSKTAKLNKTSICTRKRRFKELHCACNLFINLNFQANWEKVELIQKSSRRRRRVRAVIAAHSQREEIKWF